MPRRTDKFLAVVGVLVIMVVVPALTQCAFTVYAPHPLFAATWTAGEFLGYVGGIIGAVATIIAVRMTIQFERDERLDDQRLNVRPLIAITVLEKKASRIDSLINDTFSLPEGSERDAKGYGECLADRKFIIVSEMGGITYSTGLTSSQALRAYGGSFIDEKYDNGLVGTVKNSSLFYPLVLQSTGNGPAINVSVWMQKEGGEAPRLGGKGAYLHLPTMQLLVGEQRRLGILFEDYAAADAMGRYELVIDYYDTLSNHYQQQHKLELCPYEGGMSDTTTFSFDLKIDQKQLK